MIDELLKSGSLPPVLLLFGEEDMLVEENALAVFDHAAALDPTGMNCEKFDGEGMTIDAVLSIAQSYPMMSDKRVVWVRRFDKVSQSKDTKGTNKLTNYLTNPLPSTFLLLSASIPPADGISVAMQKNATAAKKKIGSMRFPNNVLLSNTSWVEFPRMRENQVVPWVIKRAASMSITLPPSVAEFMVARSGTALRELSMELDKLRTFIGDRNDVNDDDVMSVVGLARQYNVFELQRAIGKRDEANAMIILSKMLEDDRQELLVVTMLTRYFTALFKVMDCMSMGSAAEIAKSAGIPMFTVTEHVEAVRRLGQQCIERGLHELRTAEATIKSSSIEPRMVLQIMIARMFEG